MDIILSFLAKPVDKHGITPVQITYPPLEDPLRNIGPDRHQFDEDPTRREARFPMRTRDPFSYEDPTRREARFPVRTRDPFSYEDPKRREARFPMRTLDPFHTLGVQEDSVRPEEPFHVHDDQSRYRWQQEDSWPQNTDFAGHYGNFSGRENWFPMYHQMEQFKNWRSGQRGDMKCHINPVNQTHSGNTRKPRKIGKLP